MVLVKKVGERGVVWIRVGGVRWGRLGVLWVEVDRCGVEGGVLWCGSQTSLIFSAFFVHVLFISIFSSLTFDVR